MKRHFGECVQRLLSKEQIKEISSYLSFTLASLLFLLAANGSTRDVFFIVAFLSVICCSVLFYFIYIFNKNKTIEIYKIYLCWSLVFGIVFVFALPTYMTPDEPVHLYKTYAVSNSILNIENKPTIKMRADDFIAQGKSLHTNEGPQLEIRKNYNHYYKAISNIFVNDETLIDSGAQPIVYDSYMYVLPAIGITIGRLIGLGTVPTYIIGTFFNLMLYITLTTIAIYLTPIGKEVFFTLGLMPIVLQQVASFSCDCFVISLSFIAIALFFLLLKEIKQKNNAKVDKFLIFWGITIALLTPAKRGLCAPLLLSSIVLWKSAKNKERRKILFTSLLVLLFVICYLLIKYSSVASFLTRATGNEYTLSYIISNPGKIIRMFINTIRSYLDFWLFGFLGQKMGWFNIQLPFFITLGYIFCLIVATSKKSLEVHIEKKVSYWCYIMILLMIGIIFFGLLLGWTPMESPLVQGIQGRYFITSVLVFLLTVNLDGISFNKSISNRLIMFVPMLNILYISSLYSFIAQHY